MYKIAISGKAGSGKDTLSKLLCEELRNTGFRERIPLSCDVKGGRKFISCNLAFADPVKEIALQMFPQIKRRDLFGPSANRSKIINGAMKNGYPMSIRELTQDIAEESKKYNSKIWIEALNKKFLKACKNKPHVIVVSDLRFIDEFNYLKENNFYLIRIKRENTHTSNHISEIQQDLIQDDEFNYVVNNNAMLDDLSNQVKNIVQELIK